MRATLEGPAISAISLLKNYRVKYISRRPEQKLGSTYAHWGRLIFRREGRPRISILETTEAGARGQTGGLGGESIHNVLEEFERKLRVNSSLVGGGGGVAERMVNVRVWQEHREVKQLPILDAFEFVPSNVGGLRRRPNADLRKFLLLNFLLN